MKRCAHIITTRAEEQLLADLDGIILTMDALERQERRKEREERTILGEQPAGHGRADGLRAARYALEQARGLFVDATL